MKKMKQHLRAALALLLALSALPVLAACGGGTAPTNEETAPATAETGAAQTKGETAPATAAKTTGEVAYAEVDDPLTPEKLAAIPVANSSMTTDQLRQICVDYVCLSTTFQWVSNKNFSYEANQGEAAPIIEGKLYGGIPYVNTASGNLYRVLDFYDTATGVWDLTSFVRQKAYFGTACSGTTGWGWARVINSAVCKWTADLNVSHGLLRVGPYTYDDSIDRFGVGGAPKTSAITKQNGSKVMFDSYAKVLPGDCLVKSGHVRMVKEAPVIVYASNGTIDGAKSYVMQCEQGLFVDGDWHDRTSKNGTEYKIQGNDQKKSSFNELYNDGYLPHTFKEFLGTDPVEPAGAAFDQDPGEKVSAEKFSTLKLKANYPISDVFTEIVSPEGKVIRSSVKYAGNHFTFEIAAKDCIAFGYLTSNQISGKNTIRVTCRLGNGETFEVYSGILSEEYT